MKCFYFQYDIVLAILIVSQGIGSFYANRPNFSGNISLVRTFGDFNKAVVPMLSSTSQEFIIVQKKKIKLVKQ